MTDPASTAIEQVRHNMVSLRKARGWSCQALADRLAAAGFTLSRVALSKMETGRRGIAGADLFALAQVFDVTIDRLFQGPVCEACADAPPVGFVCLSCGKAQPAATPKPQEVRASWAGG